MKTRLITSAIGIALVIGALIIGESVPVVLAVVMALICAIISGEYLSAKKLHTELILSIPCVLFAFLIPLLSFFDLHLIFFYIFVTVTAVLTVVFHSQLKADNVMFALGGVLLFIICFTLFVRMMAEQSYRAFWVILGLGVPWLSDSAAYFVGRKLGKRKLCPVISPKKTVEGAVGGIIGGVLGAVVIGLVFLLIYRGVTINFWYLILVGVVNSVVSVFGDLFFSVIKRSCDIKDYGTIMPGHGGLLDRFDSVIFCIPLLYILSKYAVVISTSVMII